MHGPLALHDSRLYGLASPGTGTSHEDRKAGYELMQCTGLVDGNGVLIFEGDILVTDESWHYQQQHGFQCWWGTGQWLFSPFEIGNEDAPLRGIEEFSQIWEYFEYDATVQVIGNVYEHPELQCGNAPTGKDGMPAS